jgi:hypothetical protein
MAVLMDRWSLWAIWSLSNVVWTPSYACCGAFGVRLHAIAPLRCIWAILLAAMSAPSNNIRIPCYFETRSSKILCTIVHIRNRFLFQIDRVIEVFNSDSTVYITPIHWFYSSRSALWYYADSTVYIIPIRWFYSSRSALWYYAGFTVYITHSYALVLAVMFSVF